MEKKTHPSIDADSAPPALQLLRVRATGGQDGVPLVLKCVYPGITERSYWSATAYPSTPLHRYRLPEHSASCGRIYTNIYTHKERTRAQVNPENAVG